MSGPASSSSFPASGGVLDGRYQLRGELGRGAMGAVFRAHDLVGGREVAVKLLLGRLGPERLARFQREGVAAASLQHPGILRVHAAGQAGGRPYLVCELVDGCRDLGQVAPGLSLQQRVELVRDAARALGFAHARGIVHRDVKPDNLLVSSDGRLLVADFGLAAVQGEERLTRTGALLGTPHYMAPESFGGVWGPPADVWSLGVVLYQALTGALPYDAGTLIELAGQIARTTPPSVRERCPEASPDLARVCARALAADLTLRYPDGEALADDLDRVLQGVTLAAPGLRARLGQGGLRRLAAAGALALAAVAVGLALAVEVRAPASGPTTPAPRVARRPPTTDGEEAALAHAALGRLVGPARYWAGVAWLARYPDAAGADDVHRWVEADAREPLATLDLGPGWTRVCALEDGGLLTTHAEGGSVTVGLWRASGPGNSWTRVRTWAPAGPAWVLPWPGRPAALVLDGARGVAQLELDREGLTYELAPVLSNGAIKSCAVVGLREDPSFVVCTKELILSWPAARPTQPIEPELDQRQAGPAAGRLGFDRLLVGLRGERDGMLRVWELSTETILLDVPLASPPRSLDLSPDGALAAVGGDDWTIRLVDLARGPAGEPHLLHDASTSRGALARAAHEGSPDLLRFTADGRHLVSVSHDSELGGELKVWDVVTGARTGRLHLRAQTTALALDPRPGYVWLADVRGRVELRALPEPAGPRWGPE